MTAVTGVVDIRKGQEQGQNQERRSLISINIVEIGRKNIERRSIHILKQVKALVMKNQRKRKKKMLKKKS
jgi:hypothetical protein